MGAEARLRAAILDIDAHATPMGEDEDGFVTGGYLVTVGALHRALGVIGHTAPRCRLCDPERHMCVTAALMADAETKYHRDALELIARHAGVPVEADYGPKPNGVLLDDILIALGAKAGTGARL